MELELLVDRFREIPIRFRLLLVAAAGILPAIYVWTGEVDIYQAKLETAESEMQSSEANLRRAKAKVAKLPQLLANLEKIEQDLEGARKILPDTIEMDEILSAVGKLEQLHGVKVSRFQPGEISPGGDGEDYQEQVVAINLTGSFPKLMQFYDGLVHMNNLTHLRDINLQAREVPETDDDPARVEVDGRANLILFKGL